MSGRNYRAQISELICEGVNVKCRLGEKIDFSKKLPNRLVFCTRGFSGIRNTNPMEFLNFDYRKEWNWQIFSIL